MNNEQSKLTDEIRKEQRFSPTIEARFWKKVVIQNGCWRWTGAKTKGYGVLGRGKAGCGNIYAHRLSYMIHKGPIPEGLESTHRCDNPECCNPEHLKAGTHQENMHEAFERDRIKKWGRKLTAEQVSDIRSLEGKVKQKEIAKRFGIASSFVGRLFTGEHWKKGHVPHEMKRFSYKLSTQDIPQIREMLKTFSQSEVASNFGVTRTCIQAIANGRSWKNVGC